MALLIPILLISLTPAPAPPSSNTTHLYDSCKAYVRVLDDDKHPEDLMISGYCLGYIKGYFGGISAGSDDSRGLCASKATAGTLARVYTSYMDNNPKFFDESEEVGFYLAMKANYSCSAKP